MARIISLKKRVREWAKLRRIERTIVGHAINWAELRNEEEGAAGEYPDRIPQIRQAMVGADRACYEFIDCVYDNPIDSKKQKRRYDLLKRKIGRS